METRPLRWRVRLVLAALAGIAGAAEATESVVAVVSSRSGAAALSRSQVADIFLGKASRFPDGRPAVPIDQVEGSDARNEFS